MNAIYNSEIFSILVAARIFYTDAYQNRKYFLIQLNFRICPSVTTKYLTTNPVENLKGNNFMKEIN